MCKEHRSGVHFQFGSVYRLNSDLPDGLSGFRVRRRILDTTEGTHITEGTRFVFLQISGLPNLRGSTAFQFDFVQLTHQDTLLCSPDPEKNVPSARHNTIRRRGDERHEIVSRIGEQYITSLLWWRLFCSNRALIFPPSLLELEGTEG